jgi:D-glucosaminate-6-phosphate ammonia-lyase
MLEQDGNWLQGSHQGEFSLRDLAGMVEGSDIVMRSAERRPGSSVIFTFSGTVSGDTMSGQVHMGEYLTATFKATRHKYSGQRTRITVPQGPPLAT